MNSDPSHEKQPAHAGDKRPETPAFPPELQHIVINHCHQSLSSIILTLECSAPLLVMNSDPSHEKHPPMQATRDLKRRLFHQSFSTLSSIIVTLECSTPLLVMNSDPSHEKHPPMQTARDLKRQLSHRSFSTLSSIILTLECSAPLLVLFFYVSPGQSGTLDSPNGYPPYSTNFLNHENNTQQRLSV